MSQSDQGSAKTKDCGCYEKCMGETCPYENCPRRYYSAGYGYWGDCPAENHASKSANSAENTT